MEQRGHAAKKDAPNMLKEEGCAFGMGQMSNYAVVMDAQIKLGKGSVREAWSQAQAMQQRGIYKSGCEKRIVQKARGIRNANDESTAFGSEFEQTTATMPPGTLCLLV